MYTATVDYSTPNLAPKSGLRTDCHEWERRLQENGLAWGAESYVTS